MQHHKVFVKAATLPAQPIELSKSEWLWIQNRFASKQVLSEMTKTRLLKATNIYASSQRTPNSAKSITSIGKHIEDWRKNTNRLRKAIWSESSETVAIENTERAEWINQIKNGTLNLDDIVSNYFLCKSSQIESRNPLALFDRLLKGSIALSDFIDDELGENTDVSTHNKLWFLWASLIFSILRDSDHPVRSEKREGLVAGPVEMLAKLQSKLPDDLQLRKSKEALRKGAVVAYKIRKSNPTTELEKLLARWAQGDFKQKIDSSSPIVRRFNRLTSAATKPKSKRIAAS